MVIGLVERINKIKAVSWSELSHCGATRRLQCLWLLRYGQWPSKAQQTIRVTIGPLNPAHMCLRIRPCLQHLLNHAKMYEPIFSFCPSSVIYSQKVTNTIKSEKPVFYFPCKTANTVTFLNVKWETIEHFRIDWQERTTSYYLSSFFIASSSVILPHRVIFTSFIQSSRLVENKKVSERP